MGFREIQGAKGSYKELQKVTRGYRIESVPLDLGVPEIDRKCFVTGTPNPASVIELWPAHPGSNVFTQLPRIDFDHCKHRAI